MVTRILNLSDDADLRDAGDNFGNDMDIILFRANLSAAASYAIYTGSNDDLVDLDGAHPNNNNFILTGAGNDTVLGSDSVVEVFYDFTGNDYADMRGGNDTVYMGLGNDALIGGTGQDQVVFYYSLDSDGNTLGFIETGLKLDLTIKGPQNLGIFGKDVILGFEDVAGTFGNDTLLGDNAANELSGLKGNDLLDGRAGADTLLGDEGADLLWNGTGADLFILIESTPSRDIVRFKSYSDSGIGASENYVDRVRGFDGSGGATGDVIDLRKLDARVSTAKNEAFVFRGDGTFTQAGGEVRVRLLEGERYLVEIDNDADRATEMSFVVEASGTFDAADFLL